MYYTSLYFHTSLTLLLSTLRGSAFNSTFVSVFVFSPCKCGVSIRVRELHALWQRNGSTPLYMASLNGHTEVVAALLAAGARVDAATVCALCMP